MLDEELIQLRKDIHSYGYKSISSNNDFSLRVTNTHKWSWTKQIIDARLTIYNKDMLLDKNIKRLLLEYII